MPQKNEVSIDEYIGTRSLISKDGMVYRAAKMPKTFNAESRSATFVMTDETVDSYGDIVRAKGCDLTRFETNPICLLNHRSDQILGTWSDVKRIVRRIEGTATLATEGTAPHIDMAYGLMSQGILRAASIGFMPTKVERRLDENGEPLWSYDILEWQMYECSVVSVPANPAALAKSMKDGSMMARDLLEEVLDNYVKMPSGVIVAIKDIEAAHKAGGGEKTTVVVDLTEVDLDVLNAVPDSRIAMSDEALAKYRELATELLSQNKLTIESLKECEIKALNEVDGDGAEFIKKEEEAVGIWELPMKHSGEFTVNQEAELHRLAKGVSHEAADAALVALVKEKAATTAKSVKEKASLGKVTADFDTTSATEKMTALERLVDSVTAKLAKFFGSKAAEPEPVEPPAPPTAEAIETAKAKAAASRERLANKGLIEA